MNLDQLAKAANLSGRRKGSTVGGPGDLTYIYVSVRINCYTVRGDKLSGSLSTSHIAQSSQTATGQVVNGDAAANIGIVGVHLKLGRHLTDVD